jgi:hydroxyquinol 1,2-dioxygenase
MWLRILRATQEEISMTQYDSNTLTQAVLDSLSDCKDKRFRQLMEGLIRHLHDYIREVDMTPEEWMGAIQFLTKTGQMCDAKRQEYILLSDTLGVSMLVVALQQARASGDTKGATPATEATVQGPYYWEGAPELKLGTDIGVGAGVAGMPTFYYGRVTDTDGKPLRNALLDVWSGDGEGVYDMQLDNPTGMRARGKFRTDDEGRYWFWSIKPNYYPIPMDGPVGDMIRRMQRDHNRPGHIHMMVSAERHVPVTTHLFVAKSPYIESDVVFGVRDSLVVDYEQHEAGAAPDGRLMNKPYWSASYDFRLVPARD